MTLIEHNSVHGHRRTHDHAGPRAADENPTEPIPAVDVQRALLDGVGGPSGMVYTALPVVVFVTANAFCTLTMTIALAIAAAVGLAGWRILRGERLVSAAGGLFGVLAASGLAAVTGSASGFFLIGIWAALLGAVVTLASLVVRRPLTGLLWNAVHGGQHAWRADRPTLLAHDLATLAVTAVFAARFVVKQWLYLTEATGWLAFAKIAMGTPLTVVAVLVIIWAFRRSTKRLTTSAEGSSAQRVAP